MGNFLQKKRIYKVRNKIFSPWWVLRRKIGKDFNFIEFQFSSFDPSFIKADWRDESYVYMRNNIKLGKFSGSKTDPASKSQAASPDQIAFVLDGEKEISVVSPVFNPTNNTYLIT